MTDIERTRSAHVRIRNNIGFCGIQFTIPLVLHAGAENQRQIMSRRVMLIMMDAIGIHEMGIRTADLRCLRVHHVRKSRFRTSHIFTQHGAAFIGGFQKHAVQRILYRHGFTDHGLGFQR